MKCERCGALPDAEFGLHDYCELCAKNLCPKCMADGCCGHKPALSGQEADNEDEDAGE